MNNARISIHPALQQMRNHPVAPTAKEDYFQCASGDRLFYRAWVPGSPRKVIVGIHGLGAHSEYFVLVADQLLETGAALYAPDLKYHGKSTGRKGDMENYDEVIAQIHEFITFIRTQHPGLPLFLVGISMGGGMEFHYVRQHPAECQGIITFAPSIAVGGTISVTQILKSPYYLLAHLFARGKPVISIIKNSARGTSNPLRLVYDAGDPLRLQKVSFRLILEMQKGVRSVANHAEEIKIPVLIIQGTEDRLINPAGVRAFFNRLGAQDKTLIEVEGAYHALFTEPAMEEKGAWARIRDWLNAH